MLKQRKTVKLTRPVSAPEPQAHRAGEIACDELLFERLARLRKQLADERGVPPHIVFSDVSLRQMARDYPGDERRVRADQRHERKEAARSSGGCCWRWKSPRHLETQPRQMFAETSFEAPPRSRRGRAPRRARMRAEYDERLFERLRRCGGNWRRAAACRPI